MNQLTHRLIDFGIHAGDVDGITLCDGLTQLLQIMPSTVHSRITRSPTSSSALTFKSPA